MFNYNEYFVVKLMTKFKALMKVNPNNNTEYCKNTKNITIWYLQIYTWSLNTYIYIYFGILVSINSNKFNILPHFFPILCWNVMKTTQVPKIVMNNNVEHKNSEITS